MTLYSRKQVDALPPHGQSAVDLLFDPSSVAVIGASRDASSLSGRLTKRLATSNFHGEITLVHSANSDSRFSHVDSLAECAVRPDVVLLMRATRYALAGLQDAVDAGVPVCVMYNGVADEFEGFNSEVRRIISGSQTRVVGPNSMGLAQAVRNIPLTYTFPDGNVARADTPNVALVGHSGGVLQAIWQNIIECGAGAGYFASLGNECDLGVADFVDYFARQPDVSVVVAYIEEIRESGRFLAACREARRAGKRVVILRVGASSRARQLAFSHTGSMVDSFEHERVFLEDAGAICVGSVREAAVAAAAFRSSGVARAAGLGVVTASGGLSSIIADLCDDTDVDLPTLQQAGKMSDLVSRLKESELVAPELSNPMDLGAPGMNDPNLWQLAVETVVDDDSVGAVLVVCRGNYLDRAPAAVDYARKAGKPLAFYIFNRDRAGFDSLAHSGVPVYTSDIESIRAMAMVLSPASRQDTWSVDARDLDVPALPRLSTQARESTVKAWISQAGLAVPRGCEFAVADDVPLAGLRFPVVMKISDARLPHKSDVGGVVLNIADASSARAARDHLVQVAARNGLPDLETLYIEEQATIAHGLEWLFGVRSHPQYGPVVVFSLGGLLAEVQDALVACAPVGVADAERKIGELESMRLLRRRNLVSQQGLHALAEAWSRFSFITAGGRDWIDEFELNPVVLVGDTVVALDARLSVVADAAKV